jgi:hypothetical protein
MLLLGLFAGGVAGWLLHPAGDVLPPPAPGTSRPSPPSPAGPSRRADAEPASPELTSALRRTPGRPAAPTRPATPSGPAAPARPSTPADAAARSALVRARAERIRQQAQAAIERERRRGEEAERLARQQVDAELAAERARLADQEHGGLLDLIRGLRRTRTPPVGLLSSPEALGRHFEPTSSGGRMDLGRASAAPAEIGDGDVIEVPPGVSVLDVGKLDRATRQGGLPHDLVFDGAGMDRSLLVLDDEFQASGDVVNLCFRDLTVHCNDNYFVDFRKGFTLRLERCRVIGFDMGAGGSTAFRGGAGVLYATDSRIEAGFGRAPYAGNLWRVGTLLARLERCTIVGPVGDVTPRSPSLVVYDGVRFVDLEPREEKQLRAPRTDGVRLLDCRFEQSGQGVDRRRKRQRRNVSEINPAWKVPGPGR